MDEIFESRRVRLLTFFNYLNIKQVDFAKVLGKKPSQISNILSGHKNISAEFAFEVAEKYPTLNPEWVVSGNGDMLRGGYLDANNLPEWTAKQDLTLREACYRCIVDNPGQPWSALLVGAGVYLRFIQSFPGAEIPGPDDPAENEKEYHAGDGG